MTTRTAKMVLLIVTGLVAVPSHRLPAQYASLRPDTLIRITTQCPIGGRKHTIGQFSRISGDSIFFTREDLRQNADWVYPLSIITRIDVGVHDGSNALMGAALGIAVGGGLGFLIGTTSSTRSCSGGRCSTNSSDSMAEGILFFLGAVVGGGIGLLVGHNSNKWIPVPR